MHACMHACLHTPRCRAADAPPTLPACVPAGRRVRKHVSWRAVPPVSAGGGRACVGPVRAGLTWPRVSRVQPRRRHVHPLRRHQRRRLERRPEPRTAPASASSTRTGLPAALPPPPGSEASSDHRPRRGHTCCLRQHSLAPRQQGAWPGGCVRCIQRAFMCGAGSILHAAGWWGAHACEHSSWILGVPASIVALRSVRRVYQPASQPTCSMLHVGRPGSPHDQVPGPLSQPGPLQLPASVSSIQPPAPSIQHRPASSWATVRSQLLIVSGCAWEHCGALSGRLVVLVRLPFNLHRTRSSCRCGCST